MLERMNSKEVLLKQKEEEPTLECSNIQIGSGPKDSQMESELMQLQKKIMDLESKLTYGDAPD